MTDIDQNDLREYFKLYEEYEEAEESGLMDALDAKLSQYKDRFHKNPEAVLWLLEEGKNEFLDEFKVPYQDLLFDLEMHAKSMEEIRKTHTFDAVRGVWVPKAS